MTPHGQMISIDNMQDDYIRIVHHVRSFGEVVCPRGLPTRELRGVTIRHEAPWRSLPVGIGRELNSRFAAAEALQLIGAFSDPTWLKAINPNIEQFTEKNNGQFWGAYGDRITGQMRVVVQRLQEDPDTRQAQVVLWQPARDLEPGHLDYPCTTAIQFLIRKDKLECHVRMRSNDVWWGLAYDVFQFTQLQCTVANILDLGIGDYYHQPVSLHLYDRDLEAVQKLHPTEGGWFQPSGLGSPGYTWQHVEYRAMRIRKGGIGGETTLSEDWYLEKLGKYETS